MQAQSETLSKKSRNSSTRVRVSLLMHDILDESNIILEDDEEVYSTQQTIKKTGD